MLNTLALSLQVCATEIKRDTSYVLYVSTIDLENFIKLRERGGERKREEQRDRGREREREGERGKGEGGRERRRERGGEIDR